MAAPMVAGVAALATSVNLGIPAADLRAELMQNAARSPLPVAAGHLDALRSARERAGARLRRADSGGTGLSRPRAHRPVHVIAHEGIGRTRATIRAGTYPARRPIGVVTRGAKSIRSCARLRPPARSAA
jgi:hypothetical protein